MHTSAIVGITVIGLPLYVAFGCIIGKILGGATAVQRGAGYADEFSPADLKPFEVKKEKAGETVAFPHHQLA